MVKRYGFPLLMILLLTAGAPTLAAIPLPDIPKAIKGEQCVEDTGFMRRNHMALLEHQRDDTVQRGIRSKKHSLKHCFTCHVVKDDDGQPVTAADPRHFCRACHDYAAVQVDCWQCHVSTPEPSAKSVKGVQP